MDIKKYRNLGNNILNCIEHRCDYLIPFGEPGRANLSYPCYPSLRLSLCPRPIHVCVLDPSILKYFLMRYSCVYAERVPLFLGRRDGGSSPGYAVALVAESTTGVLISYEKMAVAGELPEDVGRTAAIGLLEEIRHGKPVTLYMRYYCLK